MSVIVINPFAFGAPPAAPVTPTDFVMTAISTSQIECTWSGPSTADFFDLELSADNGVTYPFTQTVAGTERAYTFNDLAPGTLHYANIRARNAGGTSGASSNFATTWS